LASHRRGATEEEEKKKKKEIAEVAASCAIATLDGKAGPTALAGRPPPSEGCWDQRNSLEHTCLARAPAGGLVRAAAPAGTNAVVDATRPPGCWTPVLVALPARRTACGTFVLIRPTERPEPYP
jgi:hypothetical protein